MMKLILMFGLISLVFSSKSLGMNMTAGQKVAATYFEGFKTKNPEQMNALYKADVEAIFNDPVFRNLSTQEVQAMWSMLLRGSKDLEVTYTVVETTETSAVVDWVATYTYSVTGKKVVNHVRSHMTLENGLITKQIDNFDLSKWTSQALPPVVAQVFAWLPDLTIRKLARKTLKNYIEKKASKN